MLSPLKILQAHLGAPEREGQPLSIYVQREGGLGDVIMALSALHALRYHRPEAKIYFHTEPRYQALAKRCPHVDGVFTEVEAFQVAMQRDLHQRRRTEVYELGPASFAINRNHEVDAFLLAMGVHARPEEKSPVVQLAPQEEAEARRSLEKHLRGFPRPWILLHPAKGDRNRTWPMAHWNALLDRILAAGCTPVVIGDNAAVPHKGIFALEIKPGVADLTNRLKLLELLQLCRMADVLVSPDSGPVQLGGLTDIGIAAIYSTVAPRCRLPFRHGMLGWRAEGLTARCPDQGCYKLILKEERRFDALQAAVKKDLQHPGSGSLNAFMGDFCTQPGTPYACLEAVAPAQVWTACERLLEVDRFLGQAEALEAAGRHILEGAGGMALEAARAAAEVSVGPETLQAEALALILEGRIEEAVGRLKQSISASPGPEALNLLGMVLYLQGEVEDAERHVDLALKWNDAYAPALYNKALLTAARAGGEGRPEEALFLLDVFRRGVESLPPQSALLTLPVGHAELLSGWIMLQHFAPEQALGRFEGALEAFPDSRDALLGVVECLARSGRGGEAKAHLQRALAQDPQWEMGQRVMHRLSGGGENEAFSPLFPLDETSQRSCP